MRKRLFVVIMAIAFVLSALAFSPPKAQAGTSWGGWNQVPGGAATFDSPTVTGYKSKLYLFLHGTDNDIWYASLAGTTWSGWNRVPGGGRTDSTPTIVSYGNLLYVFVRGFDNAIWYDSFDGTNWNTSSWRPASGGEATPSAPDAVVYQNEIHLFLHGTDNSIQESVFDTTTGTETQQQTVPGEQTLRTPSAIGYNGSLFLFVRAAFQISPGFYEESNNYQMNTSSDATTWGQWSQDIDTATVFSAPATAVYQNQDTFQPDNVIHVFAEGTSSPNGDILENLFNGSTSNSAFVPGGIETTSTPAASGYNNSLYLFVQNTNNQVWVNTLNATTI